MSIFRVLLAAVLLLTSCREGPTVVSYGASERETIAVVTELIDPARLDAIKGERGANRTLRLLCYQLENARREGMDPADLIADAQASLGVSATERAVEVKKALLRNLDILEKLGCFDEAGMGSLKAGKAPSVTLGPYAGDIASVDHIIPRSVCPELDARLYNLEFMPSKLNTMKSNAVTLRQVQLASRWNLSGLLGAEGLRAVHEAARDVSN